jgi:hypothetical protein
MGLLGTIRRVFMGRPATRPASNPSPVGGDPRKSILARIPEDRVADFHPPPDLTDKLCSIPSDHLSVLEAFIRLGAPEIGVQNCSAGRLEAGLLTVCQMYSAGTIRVVKAGSEWQVRQAATNEGS